MVTAIRTPESWTCRECAWRAGAVCEQQRHIATAVAPLHDNPWRAALLHGIHHQAVRQVDWLPHGQVGLLFLITILCCDA